MTAERCNIPLNDRERDILTHELADDCGAVDIRGISRFFAKDYVPAVDSMKELDKRTFSIMRTQVRRVTRTAMSS